VPLTEWVSVPAVLVTGPTAMQNSPFLPSSGCNHRQYSLRLPTEGWPNWVSLGGLVKYQDGTPRTVTHLSTNPARRGVTSLIRPTMLPLSQTAIVVITTAKVIWQKAASLQTRDSDSQNFPLLRRDRGLCLIQCNLGPYKCPCQMAPYCIQQL